MSAISAAAYMIENAMLFDAHVDRYRLGTRRAIGELLRDHRGSISLREVARRAKLSAPFVSDVELGRRSCSTRLLSVYESLDESEKLK